MEVWSTTSHSVALVIQDASAKQRTIKNTNDTNTCSRQPQQMSPARMETGGKKVSNWRYQKSTKIIFLNIKALHIIRQVI